MCEHCKLHNNSDCLTCPIEEQEQLEFIPLDVYVKNKQKECTTDYQSNGTFIVNLQNRIIH
jgi:hypothetical protein